MAKTSAEELGKKTEKLKEKEAIKKNIILAALTLVGVGLLQLAFAGAYLAAFHAPTVRELPVAIVGQKDVTQPLAQALQEKSDNAYKVSQFTSNTDAEQKMKKQELFAIYEPKFPVSTVTIASANGDSLAKNLPPTFSKFDEAFQAEARQKLASEPATIEIAKTPISEPKINDIAPLPRGDSAGVGLFYTAFSAVFGGYLAAVALNMVRGKRKFTRQAVFVRTAGFAVFSIITSMLIALIATHGVSAIPVSDYWAIVGIGALTTFGVSMFASAIVSLIGVFGTALVILLFVIIGNPASGGPMPVAITGGGPWHALTGVLPTGPAIDAMRQVVYFDGLEVMRHLWTPIAYAAIGFVVLFLYGIRRSSISPYESAIAEDVADDRKNRSVKRGSRAGE